MDCWSCFVEDNNGNSPENVFQLINYSRTSNKISTLSYNKALIIFEKNTISKSKKQSSMDNNKQNKKNKKSSTSSKKKNHDNNKNGLSLSITSPTSPSGQPSALSINSSEGEDDNNIPKYNLHKTSTKKKKKKDKGTPKKLSSKKKSSSTHNLLSETSPKKSSSTIASKKKKKRDKDKDNNNNRTKTKNGHKSKSKSKSQSRPTTPSSSNDNEEYHLNDHVLLNKDREGIIKFIGNVHFTKGTLYGVELLHGCIGKHDGMIDDERYFQV